MPALTFPYPLSPPLFQASDAPHPAPPDLISHPHLLSSTFKLASLRVAFTASFCLHSQLHSATTVLTHAKTATLTPTPVLPPCLSPQEFFLVSAPPTARPFPVCSRTQLLWQQSSFCLVDPYSLHGPCQCRPSASVFRHTNRPPRGLRSYDGSHPGFPPTSLLALQRAFPCMLVVYRASPRASSALSMPLSF